MEKIEQELREIKRLLLTANKNVWTVSECAEMLGISKSRLYHLVNERAVPYYKCGSQLRFKREEIEAYQCSERVPTKAELDAEARRRIGYTH